jgi:hypothetical protein
MGITTIDKLTAGMRLAADVKDRGGRIILVAGSELTDKHLKIFRMWGITQADVRGTGTAKTTAPDSQVVDPELRLEAELRVRELFFHTDMNHPAVAELIRLAVRRLAGSCEEETHGN